jgi:hypothetical protein
MATCEIAAGSKDVMEVFQKNPTDQLFFPYDIPPPSRTKFYEMLKK